MANKLLDLLMKNSKSKFTNTIQKSKYFNKTDEFTTTSVKLLNVALSGEIDLNLACGLMAGISRKLNHPRELDMFMLLNHEQSGHEGLDINEHGERAYNY